MRLVVSPSLTCRIRRQRCATPTRTRARVYKVGAMDQWFDAGGAARARGGRLVEAARAARAARARACSNRSTCCLQYHATCAKLHGVFGAAPCARAASRSCPCASRCARPPATGTSIAEGMAALVRALRCRTWARTVPHHELAAPPRVRALTHARNAPLVQLLWPACSPSSASCRVLDRAAGATGTPSGPVRAEFVERAPRSRWSAASAPGAAVEVSQGVRRWCCGADARSSANGAWSARKRVGLARGRRWRCEPRVPHAPPRGTGQGLSHAVHALCQTPPHGAGLSTRTRGSRRSSTRTSRTTRRSTSAHAPRRRARGCSTRAVRVGGPPHRLALRRQRGQFACWGGVALASESATADDTAAAHDGAPSPSETWATGGAARARARAHGRLRHARARAPGGRAADRALHSCFLGTVRVANVLLDLLNATQLALGLHKIGAEYAHRIAASDFAKYESARPPHRRGDPAALWGNAWV